MTIILFFTFTSKIYILNNATKQFAIVNSKFVIFQHAEQKTGRDVEFYSSYINPFLDEMEKEGGSDEYFYKRLTEIISEFEKENQVYNYYSQKDDVYDLIKLMTIYDIVNANKSLINKAKKYKLTSDDLPKALEVVKKIEAIDPGAKTRLKFKESLDKDMLAEKTQIKPK